MRVLLTITIITISFILNGQSSNYFAGTAAGISNTTGSSNTFVGAFAGQNNTIGSINVFLGTATGFNNISGSENSFLGNAAGLNNTIGINNSFLGYGAGLHNTTGSNNIAIGRGAGPTAANITQSNRLYIDVITSPIFGNDFGNDDPLIYGEFDNDFIRINGTFEVTAGLANPSDVNLKNNFKEIDQTEILEKLSKIEIKQWTYKDRSDEVHIGATAQDFYEAFELGADDKHISTIDADGIALAAIQALKKKNEKLQGEVDDLKILVSALIEKLNPLFLIK